MARCHGTRKTVIKTARPSHAPGEMTQLLLAAAWLTSSSVSACTLVTEADLDRLDPDDATVHPDPGDEGQGDPDVDAGADGGGSDAADGGEPGCGLVEISCGGACIDPTRDPDHCGGCDTVCAIGETCDLGTCRCPRGLTDCDDGPAADCRDLQADPANCGGCGWSCLAAGALCSRGNCGALVLDCLFCLGVGECCLAGDIAYCFDYGTDACE